MSVCVCVFMGVYMCEMCVVCITQVDVGVFQYTQVKKLDSNRNHYVQYGLCIFYNHFTVAWNLKYYETIWLLLN